MTSIFERVRGVLTEALSIDSDEVKLDTSLYQDLGAESIDLLDITFRLEREFNIKIKDHELFPTGIFDGGSDQYVQDGIVTPAGIARLKEAIPHGDFSKLGYKPRQESIPVIFTVNTLVKFVEQKQEQ